MPAFVIFALGQPARGAVCEGDTVRVGRDPKSDIVLQGETVSREHATFKRGSDGRWAVHCVSNKNPMVVQGAIITTDAMVFEGTEIVIGSDYLIVFSSNNDTARAYLGKPLVSKVECDQCHWTQLVKMGWESVCLKCAARVFMPAKEAAAPATQADFVGSDTTAQVSGEQAQALWKKIKEAKHSFVERLDGDGPHKKRLTETEPLEFGPQSPFPMRLDGITFGSLTIRWDGLHYIAESAMKFPAMKVNGNKSEFAKLRSGDLIEIGSNRFRFLTE